MCTYFVLLCHWIWLYSTLKPCPFIPWNSLCFLSRLWIMWGRMEGLNPGAVQPPGLAAVPLVWSFTIVIRFPSSSELTSFVFKERRQNKHRQEESGIFTCKSTAFKKGVIWFKSRWCVLQVEILDNDAMTWGAKWSLLKISWCLARCSLLPPWEHGQVWILKIRELSSEIWRKNPHLSSLSFHFLTESGGFSSQNKAEHPLDLGGSLCFSLTGMGPLCVCVCARVRVHGMCVVGLEINGRLGFASL